MSVRACGSYAGTGACGPVCPARLAPAIAAGRYNDQVVKIDGRWLYTVKQVRFHFFGPLEAGWDENLFALDSARGAAVRA